MAFVHLHVHSEYSLLDGLPKIPEIVKKAKELKSPAIALTDHGALYGAIEFYQECQKQKIKPIIGIEAYLAAQSRFDKEKGKNSDRNHLVLLCKNETGYRNLLTLSSLSHLEGFYYKPRIDLQLLKKHHQGLICLTACPKGVIPFLLAQDQFEKAKKKAEQLLEIFGPGNFYLEVYNHHAEDFLDGHEEGSKIHADLTRMAEENRKVVAGLVELSRRLGIPLVATNDAHYIDKKDAVAQDALVCIQTGKKIADIMRMRYVDTPVFYLKNEEEMRASFRELPEAVDNTLKIAEKVNLELELNQWHFPQYELPAGGEVESHLRNLAAEKLKTKYKKPAKELKERLSYELDIIAKKGYCDYFLIMADVMNWTKDQGILTNTRGSAAGSLVSYVLGITTVDPIEFRLPFERFLNPLRPSAPDIDLDLADNRREEVLIYITQKYGQDKVAQIATFGRMLARQAVRDMGRVLGMPYSQPDRIARMIPFGSQGFPMTIKKAMGLSPDLARAYKQEPGTEKLLDLAQKIEGNARHVSVHAAGVAIAPTKLWDFTPLQREPKGTKVITQYEMHSLEAVGLVKLDFLGIRNLSILGNAVDIVEKEKRVKVDLENLPLEDKKTFSLLAQGQTMGLFQLGGTGMTRSLRELEPSSIYDIMAMVALFRPGPMQSIPEYIRRKHDPSLVTYLDDRMKEILATSYGVITYQDDVLEIAIKLAGYNWAEVDKFRKAMGKKIPSEMAKQKDKFIEGCVKNNLSRLKAERLFSLIEPFAGYGFNKCLVGSTRVVDPKTGEYLTIKELYQHQAHAQKVLSLGKDLKLSREEIVQLKNNGTKPVFKLTVRSGRSIMATTGHRFLKFNGWKALSSLRPGDRIAVTRRIPVEGQETIESFKAAALGYLLAEGNFCHPSGFYFYSNDRGVVEEYCKALSQFENTRPTVSIRRGKAIAVYAARRKLSQDSEAVEWISSLGLKYKKAGEKFIPHFVFSLRRDLIALLLGKLFQGDGSVDLWSNLIYYATSSKRLADDVFHLLLRFGIIPSLHTKEFKYRGGRRIGYTVTIIGSENIKKFGKYVGKFLITKKQSQLKSLLESDATQRRFQPNKLVVGTADTVPVGILAILRKEAKRRYSTFARCARETQVAPRLFFRDEGKRGFTRPLLAYLSNHLDSPELRNHAESDIFWDEVKSIEPVGKKRTYDLSIRNTHCFVANDFIVHNSHAASYARVAYQTAYMKAHFPVEFMVAVLSAEAGNTEKVVAAVNECKRLGIEVLPPDINASAVDFTIEDQEGSKAIRFGLSAVKNVGQAAVEAILKARKTSPFLSLFDFCSRVDLRAINKRVLESLIKSGAMDQFGKRAAMLSGLSRILSQAHLEQKRKAAGQIGLFGGAGAEDNLLKMVLPEIEELPRKQLLAFEKELLGFYLTEHPLAPYLSLLSAKTTHKIENLSLEEDVNQKIVLGGIITEVRRILTRRDNSEMAFVRIEDETGSIEGVVFPSVYATTKSVWISDQVVLLKGRLDYREERFSLLIEDAVSLKSGTESFAPQARKERVEILIPSTASPDDLGQIKRLLRQNKGKAKVVLVFQNNGQRENIGLPFKISFSDNLQEKIELILGEGCVKVS